MKAAVFVADSIYLTTLYSDRGSVIAPALYKLPKFHIRTHRHSIQDLPIVNLANMFSLFAEAVFLYVGSWCRTARTALKWTRCSTQPHFDQRDRAAFSIYQNSTLGCELARHKARVSTFTMSTHSTTNDLANRTNRPRSCPFKCKILKNIDARPYQNKNISSEPAKSGQRRSYECPFCRDR